MEIKSTLLSILRHDLSDERRNTFEILEAFIEKSCIASKSKSVDKDVRHIVTRYLERVFFVLQEISSSKFVLNENEKKDIEKILSFVVSISVLPSLIKGIGTSLNNQSPRTNEQNLFTIKEDEKYKNLSFVVANMVEIVRKGADLKLIIIKNHMIDLLSALYQLCYAPIQKPNTSNGSTNFKMTEDFYDLITHDRAKHRQDLYYIQNTVNKVQLYQYLILMLHRHKDSHPPIFYRRSVTAQLENMLIESDGLKSLTKSLIPETTKYDSGSHWSKINLIVKLVKTKQSVEEIYFETMSLQIFELLHEGILSGCTVYSMTVLACMSEFFNDNSLRKHAVDILTNITKPLYNLVLSTHQINDGHIISLEHSLDCLHYCFVMESQVKINANELADIIDVLINMYHLWPHNELRIKIADLIHCFLEQNEINSNLFNKLFDENSSTLVSKNIQAHLHKVYHKNITVDKSLYSVIETLIYLIEQKRNHTLLYQLFIYILHEMLKTHDEKSHTSKKIIFAKVLSVLSENISIQTMITKEPMHLVNFLKSLLSKRVDINSKTEKSAENVLICLMLLESVVPNCDDNILLELQNHLKDLRLLNMSDEIDFLLDEVCRTICNQLQKANQCQPTLDEPLSRCGRALHDLCDPLLPVRAHGLTELKKLFDVQDLEAIAKRHYILCILKENLKHEDSYIYLAAINTLSSMAKVLPKEVIQLLRTEYLQQNKFEVCQTGLAEFRLKAGETLLKIVSSKGTLVKDYKSILLNTFLEAIHDDDFLVRSSGFSNLGELCKILGGNLGAEMIAQILHKVEFSIDNENSPEVRRASIFLCTQLLRGLQTENGAEKHSRGLFMLQPALMPLLRALKKSYENDEDDTLKLHAQLAIEELDIVVKEYLKLKLEMT